jgi:hypothetical protein
MALRILSLLGGGQVALRFRKREPKVSDVLFGVLVFAPDLRHRRGGSLASIATGTAAIFVGFSEREMRLTSHQGTKAPKNDFSTN